jgi:hypothetical protein
MNADPLALSVPVSLPREYSKFYTPPWKGEARFFILIEINECKSFHVIDIQELGEGLRGKVFWSNGRRVTVALKSRRDPQPDDGRESKARKWEILGRYDDQAYFAFLKSRPFSYFARFDQSMRAERGVVE